MQQVHDFNPGIGGNGLFWLMQVPDDAVKVTEDSVTISLKDVSVVDQFMIPNGAGNNLGIAGVPATVSFDITYTKTGSPRYVHPTSPDPVSPFTWAGEMWSATNSGTFSLAYNDGSFSAQGSFSSMGNFGEVGTERNGLFVDDEVKSLPAAATIPAAPPQTNTTLTPLIAPAALANVPKLKGRVPISALVH